MKKNYNKYKIKSNKDFLILSVIMFCLCIWGAKDAWFPSEKVQNRHPKTVSFYFDIDGFISTNSKFPSVGDVIEVPVYDKDDKNIVFLPEVKSVQDIKLQSPYNQEVLKDDRSLTYKPSTKNATVIEMYWPNENTLHVVKPLDYVKARTPVLMVEPNDSFWNFNRSLSIFTGIASIGFLILHSRH